LGICNVLNAFILAQAVSRALLARKRAAFGLFRILFHFVFGQHERLKAVTLVFGAITILLALVARIAATVVLIRSLGLDVMNAEVVRVRIASFGAHTGRRTETTRAVAARALVSNDLNFFDGRSTVVVAVVARGRAFAAR